MNSFFSQEQLNRWGIVSWGYTSKLSAESYPQFAQWVDKGAHAQMSYLSDERKLKRKDVREVYPEAKGALVFLFGYGESKQKWEDLNKKSPNRIAGYLVGFNGEDYHQVINKRLNEIGQELGPQFPGLEFQAAVDTSSILERDLAYRAGLGWFGKNSMLINQTHGSYFLIGSLLLNRELGWPQLPRQLDHCGQCNKCVQACPTQAIEEQTRSLISQRCISYYTIEVFKDAPTLQDHTKAQGEVFGCDICQEVCPWVKKKQALTLESPQSELKLVGPQWEALQQMVQVPAKEMLDMLAKLSNREFQSKYAGTAIARTGKKGLIKNFKSKSSSNL